MASVLEGLYPFFLGLMAIGFVLTVILTYRKSHIVNAILVWGGSLLYSLVYLGITHDPSLLVIALLTTPASVGFGYLFRKAVKKDQKEESVIHQKGTSKIMLADGVGRNNATEV